MRPGPPTRLRIRGLTFRSLVPPFRTTILGPIGLIPGAYAFLAGGGVARAQARMFIQTIGDPTGMLTTPDIEPP
jgi:hypothetical protein